MPDITEDTVQIDTSNSVFQKAVAFVTHTDENLFLTGRAGTGKTTFLKYIRTHCGKECAVIAPTGVAAINAGGETIHSFLQLPLGPFVPGNAGGFGKKADGTQDKHSLLANLRLRETKINLLRRLELLIIDEVSMVRADVMDAIDLVLRHVRSNHYVPFGGVQMVFIGDAFQLPPVVREEEWSILGLYYPGAYFFDSQVLMQNPPVYIELKKIYRQKDQSFIDILNRVRSGEVTQTDIAVLNERYVPLPPKEEGYIMLCTHNYIADDVNKRELDAIDATLHSFEGTTTGEINLKNLPAEQVLHLKKGAQVMFIKNDMQTPRRFYNGKIGTVHEINANGIQVAFADSKDKVQVPQEVWKNMRYTLDKQAGKIMEEETGSFSQFPLRLAWAVTIHKSQGLTLQKAVLDINRSFAPGQVYVALSRCTTIEGIVLRGPLHAESVKVDSRVIAFSENEHEEDELAAVLEIGARKAMAAKLQRVFSFGALLLYCRQQQPDLMKRKTGPKEQGLALLDKIIKSLEQADVHAKNFGKEVQNLVAASDNEQLEVRKKAAVHYFSQQVMASCILGVDAHFVLLETYPKIAKQTKTWNGLKEQLQAKDKELQGVLLP
ncbi:MAG: AAA family ATPase [Taibaiella sp.]|nr:AAA family ATPase [Taibaiella sp.]